MLRKFEYNAPVSLTFALICLVVLILHGITGGVTTNLLFCVYRSAWLNPLTYVRLFGHVLGHASLSHYVGNMMLLLLLGPMVEQYYGGKRLVVMMAITAVVTGLVIMLFFPHTALLGASGIVFMMIILASLTSTRTSGRIPLTFIAVAVLYLGQEIYAMVFTVDNVSQLAHLIGGATGIIFGLTYRKGARK